MDIRLYTLSWTYAYLYCIFTLLYGDGLATLYYNDRRGQPELQQAMDNAPFLPAGNLLQFRSEQDRGIPLVLTEKTSTLLSEALHMLQKIKDARERKWFEAFVHRLGSLAADLEEDNSMKTSKEVQETVLQSFDAQPSIPSSPSSALVRKFNQVQTKHQVPSAQVNEVLSVNEGSINREIITKPSLAFGVTKVTNDDLVKQLHGQDGRIKFKSSLGAPVAYNAGLLDSPVTTQDVTPFTSSNRKIKSNKIAQAQIEAGKHKKEAEMDVNNFFRQMNSQYFSGFTSGQKHNKFGSDDGIEMARREGTTAGESEESGSNSTVSLSPWQQVEAAHHPVSKAELRQSIKYFVPPEPTMSDEMERELRAGNIVVLSDSLVRTNFKSKHSNKQGSVTQSISPSQIPGSDVVQSHVSSKLSRNHSNEDK